MSKYRIQTVSQMTGLSPALIRAWEARYKLVVPRRSPAGYRLYSDEDVTILQGAQHLVSRGLAPMQVATLERAELLHHAELARLSAQDAQSPSAAPAEGSLLPLFSRRDARGAAHPAGAGGLPSAHRVRRADDGSDDDELPDAVLGAPGVKPVSRTAPAPAPLPDEGQFQERIQEVIAAFAAFDTGRVEQLLGPPLAVLPAEVSCARLLLPLLHAVGERWHDGSLSVAAEHFGTSVVRSKILTILESLRRAPGARRVVCACPPGELHELGLMMFALQATLQGWEPIYLGPNLPLFDLLDVVMRTRPDLVGLSIVQRLDGPALCRLLGEAQALLAGRVRVLVGGRGIDGLHKVVRQMGCLLLPPSGLLDDLQVTQP